MRTLKLIFCDQVGELGVVTKWNTTWHPGRVCFMSVLWTPRMVQIPEVVSGQGGWDPMGGGALQWMGVEGGARVWGCRITCAKWHHEWRRVSSKSHSWCHLAQVILHPHGLEPLPQPHSLERPLPHWVETPLPWHHFRDLTHPRCPQNWHKTDETRCSGRVSFCDHPKFPDEGTSQFFVLDPILETLLPIFLPYDRPSKGSGLSELLVAQDTVKMQGIFFDTPHQSSFVILSMFYFVIYFRIPSYLREGKPQL